MASFKAQSVALNAAVVSSYDQTKTTLVGNAQQRTFQGATVVTSPVNKWLDVFSDSGNVSGAMDVTPNGRVFAISTIAAGVAQVMCYTFNFTTGAAVYLGKIQLTFPNQAATTHTIRGFKVDDSNSAAIKIFVATSGSVLINGGLFLANAVNITDFTSILSLTMGYASGSNQKAMYFLQDPSNIGAGQLNTVADGIILDRTNLIAYIHNGVAATNSYFLYDYSLTPNVPQTTVTLTIASPGVVNWTAHGLNAGDHVSFATTGALPTGLVAGTIYFVIATGLTANTFEVAATNGGAAINFTGSQSGTQTAFRGFGETSSLWKWKTGNLPVPAGTLLNNNSESYAIPGHTVNSGSPCAFFASTTNLFLGKLSELTSGATTWPSLVTANLLGTTNQIVAPTAANASYDTDFDLAIFITSASLTIAKQVVNNAILGVSGVIENAYFEGMSQTDLIPQAGLLTLADFKWKGGWTFLLGNSIGQRGIIATDTSADDALGTTQVISKVLSLSSPSTLSNFLLSQKSLSSTAPCVVSYRTSGFGSATGGWILLPDTGAFPANTIASQIQFQIEFQTVSDAFVTMGGLLLEGYLNYTPTSLTSDNWEGSVDNTTQAGATPARTAFRMTTAYASVVPQLFFRAYDDSGNQVVLADTVTSAARFQYSTDNGTTWNSLGTIPNTALTTEVRYNWTSPPGVRVTCSLNES